MVKWKWISKEQTKECFIGITIYSVCFVLVAWLFGVGLIAMAVSAWALMLFSVYSKVEYNGLAILGICAVFATIFLGVTFFGNFSNPKTAWVNFYTVGALMAYSFMLIFNGIIKNYISAPAQVKPSNATYEKGFFSPDCGPEDLIIVIKANKDKEMVIKELEDIIERVKKHSPHGGQGESK